MPAQAPPHALQSAHAAAHVAARKFAGAAAAAGTSLMSDSGMGHASADMPGMSGSDPMPMPMSMTFSQSSDVVLLFDWWHPRSGGERVRTPSRSAPSSPSAYCRSGSLRSERASATSGRLRRPATAPLLACGEHAALG